MRLNSLLRKWRKDETGSGTVEFVIILPAIMFVFAVAFEAGLYMVRNAMLERAVDISIRDVRLGGTVPNINELREKICSEAIILKDCMNSVQIQMDSLKIEAGAIEAEKGPIKCINKSSDEDANEYTSYDVGIENEMMLVRVCALAHPIFPTTGLGLQMQAAGQNYAIVATAAFLNEPGNRASTPPPSNGTGSGGGGGVGSGVGE